MAVGYDSCYYKVVRTDQQMELADMLYILLPRNSDLAMTQLGGYDCPVCASSHAGDKLHNRRFA